MLSWSQAKRDERPGLSITFLSFFRKQAQKPSLFAGNPAKIGTERDGESRGANFSKSRRALIALRGFKSHLLRKVKGRQKSGPFYEYWDVVQR